MAKFKKHTPKKPKKQYNPSRRKPREAKRKVAKWNRYFPESTPQVELPISNTSPNKTSTQKVQDTLKYIQNNPNLNARNDLGAFIELAIKTELSDFFYELEKGNHDLYTIDDTWDGRTGTVINHITINREFTDPAAQRFLDMVSDSSWGSEEQHKKALQKAASSAYAKNVKQITRPVPNYMLDTLENIMNSSEMWHIVADKYGLGTRDYSSRKDRKSLLSDQARQDWLDVHRLIDRLATTTISDSELQQLHDMIFSYDKGNTTGDNDEYRKLKDFIGGLLVKYNKRGKRCYEENKEELKHYKTE